MSTVAAQVRPQTPQLSGSVPSATSQPLLVSPSQFPCVNAHCVLHIEALHWATVFGAVAGQASPQPPQFAASVVRSEHCAPHGVWPAPQMGAHPPPTQRVARLQTIAFPQVVPHFELSVERSRQRPSPQSTVPTTQVVTQAPPLQILPDGQVIAEPQLVPHFALSVERSRQRPSPQSMVPEEHPALVAVHAPELQR